MEECGISARAELIGKGLALLGAKLAAGFASEKRWFGP
jgi:hypothetical protein